MGGEVATFGAWRGKENGSVRACVCAHEVEDECAKMAHLKGITVRLLRIIYYYHYYHDPFHIISLSKKPFFSVSQPWRFRSAWRPSDVPRRPLSPLEA